MVVSRKLGGKGLTGLTSLAYMGVRAGTPYNFIIDERAPADTDYANLNVGDFWLHKQDDAINDLYVLTSIDEANATRAVWLEVTQLDGDIVTLTGDTGGDITATGSNFNLLASGPLTLLGDDSTSTITIQEVAGVPTSFQTNSGIAVPMSNEIEINGSGGGITTTASGSTITINASGAAADKFNTDDGNYATPSGNEIILRGTAPLSTSSSGSTVQIILATPLEVQYGGTGQSSLTDHGLIVGNDTDPVQVLTVGTDGQILLGATGGPPAFATITSTGGTVALTPGANSLNLEVTTPGAITYATDGASATPAANNLNILGGTNIDTSGDGNQTITITLESDVSLTYLANSGMATADMNTLVVNGGEAIETSGASNEVTIALTTPLFVDQGGTGAASLTDHGVLVGSGTSAITALAVGTDGQLLLGSDGADPAFATLTSADASVTFSAGTNTLALASSLGTVGSYPGNSGIATPMSNAITIEGGNGITTSAVDHTVTISLDVPVVVADGGTGTTSFTPYTVLCGGTTATNPIQNVVDTGAATYALTSNGPGALPTWQAFSGGSGQPISWTYTTADTPMVAGTGYLVDSAGLGTGNYINLSLPVTSSVGDELYLVNATDQRIPSWGAGFKVTQGAGQQIISSAIGGAKSTVGATGGITSAVTGDFIYMICIQANTLWYGYQAARFINAF